MSKPSEQIVKIAIQLAKDDSQDVGGWEMAEDIARAKLNIDPIPYLVQAIMDYLDTPKSNPTLNKRMSDDG